MASNCFFAIQSVSCLNIKFPADLVTFNEEILNEKTFLCSVYYVYVRSFNCK